MNGVEKLLNRLTKDIEDLKELESRLSKSQDKGTIESIIADAENIKAQIKKNIESENTEKDEKHGKEAL